jgi:hypothetical protein
MKKLIIALLAIFTLLIGAAIAFPFFFKDKLLIATKKAFAENYNANLEFKDVDITLIKSFPDLRLQLNNVKVTGIKQYKDIALIDAKNILLDFDLMSAWKGDTYKVNALYIDDAKINALVDSQGNANWDITKPLPEESSTPFSMKVESYALRNCNIIYDDATIPMRAELIGFTHTGNGDFTQATFDLKTKTNIEKVNVKYSGIQYLKEAKLNMDLILGVINGNDMRFDIKENNLNINALDIESKGYFTMRANNSYNMDINYLCKQAEFKSFLSLIPSAFTSDFNNVKTKGKLALNGFVKGVLSEKIYPSFGLNLEIKDAMFQYPSLPKAVNNIQAKVNVNNPSNNLDATVINIPSLHFEIDNQPLDMKILLSNLMSNPNFDVSAKGNLNLASLAQAYPMNNVKQLRGSINMDIAAKGNQRAIDEKKYESIDVKGFAKLSNLIYESTDLPKPLNISTAEFNFTPQYVNMPNFVANVGNSDINANGKLENFIPYFLKNETIKGNVILSSNNININDIMPQNSEKTATNDAQTTQANPIPANIDFDVKSTIKKLTYEKTIFKDIIGNFALKNAKIGGNLNIATDYIDVNQWMPTTPETATTQTSTPFIVPNYVDFDLNANIGKLKYDKLIMTNVNGNVNIKDEKVSMNNLKGNGLEGTMAMNGYYSTKNMINNKPDFNIIFGLTNVDFASVFKTFNTVEKIAPIAQYIQGKFSTDLKMNGKLGSDMIPDLNTLTGEGFVSTINAVLSGFKPLELIAEKLKIEKLKNLKITDTKNWVEIATGRVKVRPFDYKFQNYAMNIGGSTGFDKTIDYDIKLNIPRSELGSQANSALSSVFAQANKAGVDLKAAENIDVAIKMTGTVIQPKIQVDWAKTTNTIKQQVVEAVKDRVEAVKNEAIDKAKLEAEKLKAEAEAKKKEIEDKVRAEAEAKKKEIEDKARAEAERIKKQAEEEAKKKGKDLIKGIFGK